MSLGVRAPAQLPPPGLAGLDPSWSRLVHVPATDATWHILDSGIESPRLTLLCVHGNPTWSYLWRNVVARAPHDVRVIAVDQLDMGFSERTGRDRLLSTRIDDLCELTDELGLESPVITVAHDWGGPISLGWAQRHREQLAGVVLTNTAVHQPAGSPAPTVIRLARTRGVLRRLTVDTTAFIRAASEMSRPRPPAEVRAGFLAPYASADRREAIQCFVEDIPLDAGHPSAATLDAVAAGLDDLADTPALLMWGPRDPVFSDLYLHDLQRRLPHAGVHRFVGASHFVSEDADIVTALYDWIDALSTDAAAAADDTVIEPDVERRPAWAGFTQHPTPGQAAVVEIGGGRRSSITFAGLADRVDATAAGLLASGVDAGQRVAIMIPPGIDLSVALNAVWRAGATAVLVDAGLGRAGMGRALAAAAPDHLIGIPKAIAAARALRWPGRRISSTPIDGPRQRVLGCTEDLRSLARRAPVGLALHGPDGGDPAAIVFTSGATGPSKGVVYRHRKIQAQRDALMALYDIRPDDRLVAAFAPFALYGPAMGITSIVPDMDVAAPGTLTATALGDAVAAVDASLVFASPAALANVLRTATDLSPQHRRAFEQVRLVLSAGAPVGRELLADTGELFPNAELHTPYGMTEVLPVADITLEELDLVGQGDGVCVGHPIEGVDVRIWPLDHHGAATDSPSSEPCVLGEIVIRAGHARDGYDRLWHTGHLASQPPGWHRSGDVGHVDADGRLWVAGRIGHVITTPGGPVAPVGIEQAVERLDDVRLAAAVSIGPTGTQHIVVVVEIERGHRSPRLADLDLHDRVRAAVDHDVAAVFTVPDLPVDRRHNSKIDRTRVAAWAGKALAGGRLPRW